jgi:aminopeptidase N
MSDKTVYLRDYTPPVFSLSTVDLQFDIYKHHTDVTSTMYFERTHPGVFSLLGDGLEFCELKLNGEVLDEARYTVSPNTLELVDCPDTGELTVITRIYPDKNTALSGLYYADELFCTQCEAQGFRRITYFPDRPDVLAVYTTRISADKKTCPVLLSNGNLMESGDGDDGRHWALWHDPFKKPSYLFALVAGDLACVRDTYVTASGRTVDLRLYVEHGDEDKTSHALASLKAAMQWDEREYGREYDLDIFMIVAVSSFNMGAMENKGLNVFNASCVLARPDTATDGDYAQIESIVAHEYFHNWTGNRVTCRDWFQLSLKEGLTVFRDQEFSRDMNSRDVNRIQDVSVLRQVQFPEDAGCMAHPVRPPAYQAIDNFYTATVYNKGAEVIRMLQTLLGREGFRRGTDVYFERHDGEAVTIEDFVAAMADANDTDLTQFFRWYTQAGTPEVMLTEQVYEGGTLRLTFTQTCPETPDKLVKEPFPIPIDTALFNAAGVDLASPVLLLEEAEQTFQIDGLQEAPAHVSFLRGFSAPVCLDDGGDLDARLGLLRVETDGFARWDAGQRVVRSVIMGLHEEDNAGSCTLDEAVVDAFRGILTDASSDDALRAELLMPPGFEAVVSGLQNMDVLRVERARDAYKRALGVALWPELVTMYDMLWGKEDHAMHGVAYGRRHLRNICLLLMMKAKPADALSRCEEQFKQAKTMTDQITSFGLLVNGPNADVREDAIEQFYGQWRDESLVLDKWFAVQAGANLEGGCARVQALMAHPAFELKNPNNVRAVMGSFCGSNLQNFHAEDGGGYAFLREIIMKVDAMNPMLASGLTRPFTRWTRYDAPRQEHMLYALEQLAQADVSANVRELVDKSLER